MFVVEQVAALARKHHASGLHDIGAVRDAEGLVHVLFHEQDGNAFLVDAGNF